jgi:FMN phosphatase YigB (HAD superfamily)
MVKTVVFDLGKVLLDFDYAIAARKIASRGRLTLDGLVRFMSQSPLLEHYETGLLTSRQFYDEVCAATGYGGDLEEFGLSFGDIFSPIEPMIQLHASLRQRGMPTFILSNTNDLAVTHIRRTYPFFANFDGYVFSYEHGAMKPAPRLYEILEQTAGSRGPELLYIDDRPENVAAGAARGWQVILQETPEKTLKSIRELGLPVL